MASYLANLSNTQVNLKVQGSQLSLPPMFVQKVQESAVEQLHKILGSFKGVILFPNAVAARRELEGTIPQHALLLLNDDIELDFAELHVAELSAELELLLASVKEKRQALRIAKKRERQLRNGRQGYFNFF